MIHVVRAIAVVLVLAAILLGGCDFNPGADRTGCDGFIEVLRTLPDTTLVEDGPPLVQELEGEEPFFRHTEGKRLTYRASDTSTPAFTVSTSVVGASAATLRVIPTKVGMAKVIVRAQDDCQKEARFSFNVEVIPGE
jgi:hypothetical protein